MGAEEMEARQVSPEMFEKLKKWVYENTLYTVAGAAEGAGDLLAILNSLPPAPPVPLFSEISPEPWKITEEHGWIFDRDGESVGCVNVRDKDLIRSAPELRKSLHELVMIFRNYTGTPGTKKAIAEARKVLKDAGVNMEVSE